MCFLENVMLLNFGNRSYLNYSHKLVLDLKFLICQIPAFHGQRVKLRFLFLLVRGCMRLPERVGCAHAAIPFLQFPSLSGVWADMYLVPSMFFKLPFWDFCLSSQCMALKHFTIEPGQLYYSLPWDVLIHMRQYQPSQLPYPTGDIVSVEKVCVIIQILTDLLGLLIYIPFCFSNFCWVMTANKNRI